MGETEIEKYGVQYMDSKYSTWYFVPWPDCQYFDNMKDDDHVISINTQTLIGSFVDAEWVSNNFQEE